MPPLKSTKRSASDALGDVFASRAIGRFQGVQPEVGLDVRDQQLLMLLLVVETQLDAVRETSSSARSSRPLHGIVHMGVR